MLISYCIGVSGIIPCNAECQNLPFGGFWNDRSMVDYKNTIFNLFDYINGVLYMAAYGIVPYYQAGVFWTIPIEIRNSFVVYGIAYIYKNLKSAQWLFLSVLGFSAFSLLHWYSPFVLGFLLAVSSTNGWTEKILSKKNKYVLATRYFVQILLVIFLLCDRIFGVFDNAQDWAQFPYSGVVLQQFLVALAWIVLVESSTLIQYLLSMKLFTFLGRASFGLYLMHGPMLPLVRVFLSSFSKLSTVVLFWTSISLYFAFALGLGYLFSRFVDEKLVRFINKVYKFVFVNGKLDMYLEKQWIKIRAFNIN